MARINRALMTYLRRQVESKSASYSVVRGKDYGKLFNYTGASGGTFTLPNPTAGDKGAEVIFMNRTAQVMTVRAVSADKLVAAGDAAATSVSSTVIGSGFHAICDGTLWVILPIGVGTVTVTG